MPPPRKKARGSFRSFEDARAYVRALGLKSAKEWQAWSKSGARPHDMPSHPQMTYASSGWLSYGDFLGYDKGKAAGSFRSFEDARKYVRTLGLKSKKEWEAWSSSGARPYDIPGNPNVTYASSGWLSYGDFLGYAEGKVVGTFPASRMRARTFARSVGRARRSGRRGVRQARDLTTYRALLIGRTRHQAGRRTATSSDTRRARRQARFAASRMRARTCARLA